MAMSLEELLAKEGFKERKLKMSARASFQSDQTKLRTSSASRRTERVKSDILRYTSSNNELSKTNRTKERLSKSILIRKETINEGPTEEIKVKTERVASYLQDAQRLTVEKQGFVDDDKAEATFDSSDTYKDIYSNEIYSPRTSEREIERIKSKKGESSDVRKTIENNRNSRYPEIEPNSPEITIDKAAIQAVISILNGYTKRFLRDKDFRTSFHHNCCASLNFSELGQDLITENKVLANLEQAIEVVEKAAEENTISKELKKASLQLSVITGLNANELKDGFTSGVPNSKLSACAHLYLGVVYKLLRKDKVAAKHILQVFCESPFQARVILLPELWEHMFLPHLVHLKEWYIQQSEFLEDTPRKTRKLKLLEKVYNDIMDSGTYQFAVYYKDWLAEGIEAPSIPLINIPSTSFQGPKQYSSRVVYDKGSRSDSFDKGNPEPVVSRDLYDPVFDPEADDVDGYKEPSIFPGILTSYGSSPVVEKQALPCSSTATKHTEQIDERHYASHPEHNLVNKEVSTVQQASAPIQENVSEKSCKSSVSTVEAEANELTLNRLARSVFARDKTDGTLNLIGEGAESRVTYDKSDEESFCSTIPEDFVCPLTRLIFEDPVTLETGHTYEREAITEWLNQGNKTCPVSEKTLEHHSVPLTNFILKRVIKRWKSEHSSEIQNEEALLVINQLITASSPEERIANTKHLLSLGGLSVLIQKFQSRNLEERSRVAAIFSCCIEADNGCRYYIAKNMNKSCLVELIRSEHVKSKENVTLLLVELMCLNRRKDINLMLSGLKDEGMSETLHAMSVYLNRCPPQQRPLVAILLLHFDLLVEPREYSVYREEAVDAIITALDDSSSVDNIRTSCCKALLILGGRFSSSGKIMTENWVLKQSGFLDSTGSNSGEHNNSDVLAEENCILDEDEEMEIEEWLKKLSVSLLCDGKKSFLQCISKCLGGENSDMARVCLTTVAWLSSALASFSDNEFPISAFCSLILKLKETLEKCDLVEHKILASVSLFNFSKIPECKILLKTFAKEIVGPLRNLAEVTWTAKELYAIICPKGA